MRGIRGKTSRRNSAQRDQPRTCGEYYTSLETTLYPPGSAPHMRGILRALDPRSDGSRISPAHAGNTATRPTPPGRAWDQPRTCGEYIPTKCWPHRDTGSAPHMRGIPTMRRIPGTSARISPAHAGNTRKTTWEEVRKWDQPRTCGEYSTPLPRHPLSGGSAPHMRGIRGFSCPRYPSGRISPAHAGNTP